MEDLYLSPYPRFAGSNPAEVDGFFQDIISGSLKNLKLEKIGIWAKFNRDIHVLVIP